MNNNFQKSKKIYGVQAAAVSIALGNEQLQIATSEVGEGWSQSGLACLIKEGTAASDTSAITKANVKSKILAARTEVVKAFCQKVASYGKEAGVYASESWFQNNLDYNQVKQYKIWCAKYGTNDGNAQTKPALEKVDMWQYTSKGTVSGVSGNLDLSECYFEIKRETTVSAPQPVQSSSKYIENERVGKYQHAANIGFDLVGTSLELAEDCKFGPKSQNIAKTHLIYYGIQGCPTAVKWWQGVIGAKIDGKFKDETLRLTRAWQRAHGLVADGVVGLATVTEAIK